MIVERINDRTNAFDLIYDFNIEIGRELSDDELRVGIRKFLDYGNVIGVLNGEKLIAMMNLYCNNDETLEAYMNNVYVLDSYRGKGLSKKMMDIAISICKDKHFKKIKLHVAPDNVVAIQLYEKYDFVLLPGTHSQGGNGEELVEMVLSLA